MTAQATTAALDEPAAPGVGSGYRPFLDGLRAVAVYLVVLFHAGSDRFSGGFVGVDVFFVLSGFLVTQLLLRDVASTGSVRYGRFYARRFRRLLPAAFVALVVTALVFSALASPVEVADSVGGFKAAFLYVTNWYFIDQASDYFAGDLTADPVLHFWSLAVEEQFYLLWPLVLGGLFAVSRRFGPRQRDVVRVVVAVGAVASVLWALSLRSSNPGRAYYGTDARAYQLMAGALLALTPAVLAPLARYARPLRWVAGIALAALVVVASSESDALDAIERGVAVTLVTVVLLVALEVGDGGLVRRGLSLTPVAYLGKISYGTYLWHWPVVLVLARTFELSTISTVAWTTLVATALASLSYQLMEHPIRVSTLLDRHRAPVIVAGLAISVVSALVIIPAIVEPSSTSAAPITGDGLTAEGFTPVPAGLDYEALALIPPSTNCLGQPATTCTLVQGTGPHILLMGDSHASMLIPMFRAIAETHDLTLSVATRGGCPWQRDLFVAQIVADVDASQDACAETRDDTYDRVIPALDPDTVVLVNFAYEAPDQFVVFLGPDREVIPRGSPDLPAWVEEATVSALAELGADGRQVVAIEPIPRTLGIDSLACLSDAAVVEECRQVVSVGPTYVEELYRRSDDADPLVWAADLDPLVCPFLPICDPIVSRHVVRADGNHLSREFAEFLAPSFADYLTANGILPE